MFPSLPIPFIIRKIVMSKGHLNTYGTRAKNPRPADASDY